MRKFKMSDAALAEALSHVPDWKSGRRATVAPVVDGPSYLPGYKTWGVRWEEIARLPGAVPVMKERRFRTLKARDSWVQLISEKPTFLRFLSFDEPEGDPS
jgi:hypothetical protein